VERRRILHRGLWSKVRGLALCGLIFLTMTRFERELEALRKELVEAQSKSQHSSPTMDPSEAESEPVSPLLKSQALDDEAGGEPDMLTLANGGLSLQLEETKKDK
jgi:hypothetical protein